MAVPRHSSPRHAGALRTFTLLELLVVVSIVMILASLLMPSLSSAMMLARSTACANNLRDLYHATAMYTDDNAGMLPGVTWNAQHITYLNTYLQQTFDNVPLTRSAKYNGCYSMGPANLKPGGNSAYCPALYSNPDESPSWSGGTAGVYFYPNYMVTYRSGSVSTRTSRSGCWLLYLVEGEYPSRKLSNVMPSSVIMSESNYYTTSAYNSKGQANQAGTIYNTRANADISFPSAPAWNLHAGGANFLFQDGHLSKYIMGVNFNEADYTPVR